MFNGKDKLKWWVLAVIVVFFILWSSYGHVYGF